MLILPAITTIFDWRGKIKEINDLKLKEIALFLTCVNFQEREELYGLIKRTRIKKVPFVHIRSDMKIEEINYLIKNYHTEVFNIHTKKECPYPPNYRQYSGMIYVENAYEPFNEKEINKFAGICLDFSHLENSRIFKPVLYKHNVEIIEKYVCGCSHISPTKDFSLLEKRGAYYPRNAHPHTMEKLSDLDYLKRYPIQYFGKFAALEMENSIKEQLRAKEYLASF